MSTATTKLYETDFYGWTQRQADTLRNRNMDELDFDNLIEEIESMGRSEKRELESRIELLLMHLLKWRYQPERRGASWEATIKEQRERIARHIKENPSLQPFIPQAYGDVYRYALLAAIKETGVKSLFPAQCPWTFEQAMNVDFWPEA